MAATVAKLAERALRRLQVVPVAAADRPELDPAAGSSLADVGLGALRWLGIVSSDEIPATSDATIATAKAQAIHEGLIAQGLVSWGADGIVPRFVSEDYVMLTALHLAPLFGKAGDPEALNRVQERIGRKATLLTAQSDAEQAVQDVHAMLSSRGWVRWTLFDIPDYAEQPYVVLAANRLAPLFGMQPDQLGEVRVQLELARAIALPSTGQPVRQEYF